MYSRNERGVTLIELLISLTISALLLATFSRLYQSVFNAQDAIRTRAELTQDARFAMNRMVDALQSTDRLILPLSDQPRSDFNEARRQQTFPESTPQTGSSRDSAVLAVALPASQDLDFDGFPDADNDRDGRRDEDWGGDMTNDNANGIVDIDDNGDGRVDETFFGLDRNDDEYMSRSDEDPINGYDDDNDGSVDEDSGSDMNDDGAPGIVLVDDDGDGLVDEGEDNDDDEDGVSDEDWLDALVFELKDSTLIERRPVPYDENNDGVIDGEDYIVEAIADDVTLLRFERLTGTAPLVEIELQLERSDEVVNVITRARVK